MTDDTDTHVRLPAALVEQCEARIAGTEFESVDEYVEFVVRTVVEGGEGGADADDAADRDGTDVSADVEDRLASLGYR